MASKLFSFSVFVYVVQVSFSFPHSIGHNNYGGLANVYNNPNNILHQRNTGASLGIANIGQSTAANSLAAANIGSNVASNSLATANVGLNNLASHSNKASFRSRDWQNNNGVTSSGLDHMDLRQLAKKPNANQLASNVLGKTSAGSLATSSASARSLARDFTSHPPNNRVGSTPVSLGTRAGTVYGNVGVTAASTADVALEDEGIAPDVECPDNMEIIGYVSFEGYLPVEGTVKVAEGTENCSV